MFGSDPLATSPYTPFLARLTAVASGSGGQANWWLYSFREQGWDSNGFPVDLNPGRNGSPSSGYAFEVNNTLLTVPGTTPTGFTNPGPYVWMKLKGVVGGIPVYEFEAPSTSSGGVSFSGARYPGNGATQNVANNSTVTVTFNGTASYDTDAYTKSLVAPIMGYYHGFFQVSFPFASVGTYAAGITAFTSGSQQLGHVTNLVGAFPSGIMQVYWEGHLSAGESVACQAFQLSGGTAAVTPQIAVISLMLIPAGTLASEGL